jgi:hypothetical protein
MERQTPPAGLCSTNSCAFPACLGALSRLSPDSKEWRGAAVQCLGVCTLLLYCTPYSRLYQPNRCGRSSLVEWWQNAQQTDIRSRSDTFPAPVCKVSQIESRLQADSARNHTMQSIHVPNVIQRYFMRCKCQACHPERQYTCDQRVRHAL